MDDLNKSEELGKAVHALVLQTLVELSGLQLQLGQMRAVFELNWPSPKELPLKRKLHRK